MANSVNLALEQVEVIPVESTGREVFVYADGKRTEQKRVNALGQPLYRFGGVIVVGDSEVEASVLSPVGPEQIEGFRLGRTVLVAPKAVLTIGNSRDSFDLRVSVEVSALALERSPQK